MPQLIHSARPGMPGRPDRAAVAGSNLALPCLLAAALVIVVHPVPAQAQSSDAGQAAATPHAAASITPDQARQALDILRDSGRRQDLIAVLDAIVKAAPTATSQSVPAAAQSTPGGSAGGGAPAGPGAGASAAAPAQGQSTPAPGNTSAGDASGAKPEAPVSLTSDSLLGQIIAAISNWLTTLSGFLAAAGSALSSVPLLWKWAERIATNPFAQSSVLDAAWRLAAALVGAGIAEWLTRRALRRLVQALERRARTLVERRRRTGAAGEIPANRSATVASRAELRFLRRLPLALAHLALRLVPIGIFALAGNVLAAGLNDGWTVRLIVLAAVNAYVIQQVIMAVGQALFSPECRELRLFRLTDETAAYIQVWLGRVTGVAIYGMAALDIARMLGLYPRAYASAAKLLILVCHVLLIIVVLQCRRGVADLIRAPEGSTSTYAMLRNWLARIWHIPAIFLLLALWFVGALEVENGYSLLLRYSGATILVMIIARLVAVALLGLLDRAFRIEPRTAQRLPFLAAR
ncbi:MAG TPA: hypothetical protein VE684_08485, partial [Crenalkalicoccus sp.]|nr:hypothetical protein [Crenalkalicoccus sp.]